MMEAEGGNRGEAPAGGGSVDGKNAPRDRGLGCLAIPVVLGTAFLILVDLVWVSGLYLQWCSGTWPVVSGRVQEIEVRTENKGSNASTFGIFLRYSYEVKGLRYTDSRWRFLDEPWSLTQEEAEAYIEAHPPGSSLDVAHDPAVPERSVLRPGASGGDVLLLVLLASVNLLGLVGIVGFGVVLGRAVRKGAGSH